MEITGVVFICVIFTITMAVLGFCCLKSCSSEEKYIRNSENNIPSEVLPSSDCNTELGNNTVYPLTITSNNTSKSSSLDQTKERNESNSKSGFNPSSPSTQCPAPGLVQSALPKPPLDTTRSLPPKHVIVHRTRSAPLKPGFIINGTQSAMPKTVVEDKQPGAPKQALVYRTRSAPQKPGFVIHGIQTVSPKPFSIAQSVAPNQTIENRTESGPPKGALPKPGRVEDSGTTQSGAPKQIVVHRTRSAPPKSGFVISGTQSARSKPVEQFGVPKPGVINSIRSAATKLGFLKRETPKGGVYEDGPEFTSPKRLLVVRRTQSAASRPGYIVAAKPDFIVDTKKIVTSAPPKPSLVFDEAESSNTVNPIGSTFRSKPLPIGFGETAEAINADSRTTVLSVSNPYSSTARRRTPSPNPEKYKTSYSPRTSAFFENEGPFSGIVFSSQRFNHSSKPRPPSYEEAMLEHQFPINSTEEQSSEHKVNS